MEKKHSARYTHGHVTPSISRRLTDRLAFTWPVRVRALPVMPGESGEVVPKMCGCLGSKNFPGTSSLPWLSGTRVYISHVRPVMLGQCRNNTARVVAWSWGCNEFEIVWFKMAMYSICTPGTFRLLDLFLLLVYRILFVGKWRETRTTTKAFIIW